MYFWNSLAFSMIQRMLAIWSLVPLPFLKPAWTSASSRFPYCWSLAWRILSINLNSVPITRPLQCPPYFKNRSLYPVVYRQRVDECTWTVKLTLFSSSQFAYLRPFRSGTGIYHAWSDNLWTFYYSSEHFGENILFFCELSTNVFYALENASKFSVTYILMKVTLTSAF